MYSEKMRIKIIFINLNSENKATEVKYLIIDPINNYISPEQTYLLTAPYFQFIQDDPNLKEFIKEKRNEIRTLRAADPF